MFTLDYIRLLSCSLCSFIPALGAKLDKKFANFTKIPKFLINNIMVKVNVIRYFTVTSVRLC
jgi:hypothetical protein